MTEYDKKRMPLDWYLGLNLNRDILILRAEETKIQRLILEDFPRPLER